MKGLVTASPLSGTRRSARRRVAKDLGHDGSYDVVHAEILGHDASHDAPHVVAHDALSASSAHLLVDLGVFQRKQLARLEKEAAGENWLQSLLDFPEDAISTVPKKGLAKSEPDVRWS